MNIFRTINLCVLALLLFSCAEDRTYEYDEKTQANHEMQAVMQEWYLWGDSLKEMEWQKYFATPQAFIERLMAQGKAGDKWSYCSIDTTRTDYFPIGQVDRTNTYGIDFALMTDPTGETTKQYARVLTVYPNSPASRCGLRRGDFISQIGDSKMSRTVMTHLQRGISRKLVVNRLAIDSDTETLYWAETDTVSMEQSSSLVIPTVLSSTMLYDDVAYIMLTDLNDFDVIAPRLTPLLSQSPSDIIVDLRLCNQGTLDCVLSLAQAIGNVSGTLLTTIWNSNKSVNNESFVVEGNSSIRVFFITSSYTRGAAEWLIYGMRSLDASLVSVVGTYTAGQTVMLYDIPTSHAYTIHPAVCFVCNGEGQRAYIAGITPDSSIDEFAYAFLYPYGNPDETIVNYIVSNN